MRFWFMSQTDYFQNIFKNIMKINILKDQADTLRQKQMTTSTHWAR